MRDAMDQPSAVVVRPNLKHWAVQTSRLYWAQTKHVMRRVQNSKRSATRGLEERRIFVLPGRVKNGGRKANDSSLRWIWEADSIYFQPIALKHRCPASVVGEGGKARGEGATLAEGWPHLRRGTMLRLLTSPPLRPLPIRASPFLALNRGLWTARPLLCLQRPSNSGNWEPVGRLSDTSMDCQQGRDF